MSYVVTWQLLLLLSIESIKHTILLSSQEFLASICFPYLFSCPTAFRQRAAHSLLSRYKRGQWRTWWGKNNPYASLGSMSILAGIMKYEKKGFQFNTHFCWKQGNPLHAAEWSMALAQWGGAGRGQKVPDSFAHVGNTLWNMASTSKWCSSSKLPRIPNQLRTE